ncbi:MAG: hypothetical protein RLZZ342_35 [Candidatus Parcubacteria bacterium]|jgi:hypothetical protein
MWAHATQKARRIPGAKPWMKIPEEVLDDREWLSELVRLTAEALPKPAPKKKRAKRR